MADEAAQSIDSLLADDEGQEIEQEKPAAQLLVLNADQVFGAEYMAPLPVADILAESVDSLMADNDVQEQEQEGTWSLHLVSFYLYIYVSSVDLAPRQCKHLCCYIGGFFTVSLV